MRYAMIPALVALSGSALLGAAAGGGRPSALWGERGEKWSPQSRLPDFSFAGYHCGESAPPYVKQVADVTRFGARGDGQTDDTQAFLDAIAAAHDGAVYAPPGHYKITRILEINKSGVVLRGAGADRTILSFPRTLTDVKPDWGATTTGDRTSNYSWSGGFVRLAGSFQSQTLARVAGEARHGDSALKLSSVEGLRIGQRVEIRQADSADRSLLDNLYSGDPGDTRKITAPVRPRMVCRIRGIEGDTVTLDRPLRFDVRPQWQPEVRRFEPTVSESGVEDLCFEFPVTAYKGHFTELGYNAIAMTGVADCWVRNVRIVNPDSGLFIGGAFCTLENVVFETARRPDRSGSTGHHGIYFTNDDNLYTGFDYRMSFIHDITMSVCAAGNVCANGRGVDLCFDHHKRAPFENLFTHIDAGEGTHLWRCGGGAALGKHTGARETFWNIRARRPQAYPPNGFGPASMNLVGVQTNGPSETSERGKWFEAIPPETLVPQDLHAAQLARRLGGR